MTEADKATAGDASVGEIRGTLVKRLAMAGGLVAILLGVLAFFDYLASPPEEPEAPVFSKPVPVAPKKEVSQPVTPAENLPEPPAAVVAEPVTEAPPAPKAELPPAKETEAKPGATEKHPAVAPVAPPASATKSAPPVPAPVQKPITTAPSAPVRPVPEASSAPEPAPVAAKPATRALEIHPAPIVVPPSAPRLFSGFLLQAGVFSSAQRAEELHAKLTLSGVPSTLETRVQVGPFRTRQEAEAAQAKLRELGVQTILVPPKSGKP